MHKRLQRLCERFTLAEAEAHGITTLWRSPGSIFWLQLLYDHSQDESDRQVTSRQPCNSPVTEDLQVICEQQSTEPHEYSASMLLHRQDTQTSSDSCCPLHYHSSTETGTESAALAVSSCHHTS
ncbi:alpha-1B adrenergic receptor isoform X2 [Apus apus]|uniref:alpha-1B adrenergic receptor isoform X2 n=1 Tax=Apus apus TaxID=8895 RepID=UPI0021F91545|nr:alpha-1B adrenergic receptor isoform X2 [Apus apus]